MRLTVAVIFASMIGYFILGDAIRDLASPREVFVYPIECKGKAIGNLCDGTLGIPLNPSSFVAFPDRQEVVEYSGGMVTRLEGCAVFNWQTWTCTTGDSDDSMTQVMDRGEFTEYYQPQGPAASLPGTVYVSAWQYYWHRFTWKPSG